MENERWQIIGAFAVIYFVWGSTYLANYWAIQSIPPFLMCGSRFLGAGLLLFLFTLHRGAPWPTLKQWTNAGLIGMLFLSVGTGATVWAQQFIPTSLTALIVSFDPLVIMLFMWLLLKSRPAKRALFGALVSIVGVSLLVGQPQLGGNPESYKGLLAISVAFVAWAIGSIYASRLDMGKNRIRGTAMQMIVGGLAVSAFSGAIDETSTWEWTMIDRRSLWSWGYLILFGSIFGYTCFNYLLSKVSPEKVATSTYVNPVVALLLGGWLNNELISTQSLVAGGVMLTGVYFINSAK